MFWSERCVILLELTVAQVKGVNVSTCLFICVVADDNMMCSLWSAGQRLVSDIGIAPVTLKVTAITDLIRWSYQHREPLP